MSARAPDAASTSREPRAASVRAAMVVIGTGFFVTGLGWPGLIGRLPLSLLLKNQLALPPQDLATFWAIATLPWYLKPLVGLVADAYPLFGTRRRGYLIACAIAAGAVWLAFAIVPRAYLPLLAATTALNVPLVFASTTLGGILVEAGQRHRITGRLSAVRAAAVGAMSLVAGPLGGWLAARALGWTAAAGALVMLSFVPVAALFYREPPAARADRATAVGTARRHLGELVRSRAMWSTAGLLFLVYLAPGFQTPLLYYQQDVLRFDARTLGTLQLIGGAGAIAGAVAYGLVCRRLPLRGLLIGGIVLNAASTLLYLGYDSRPSAAAITGLAAFCGTIATLPLFDLAARATPRGAESLGYAILLAIESFTMFALSEKLGAALYGRLHVGFKSLVWINAGSTAAVLLFTPLLPRRLMDRSETTPETPAA